MDDNLHSLPRQLIELRMEHADLDNLIDRALLDAASDDLTLRRLKKRLDREGTLKDVRAHRHYEKPSERRRRKMKAARFSAMLTARYADL